LFEKFLETHLNAGITNIENVPQKPHESWKRLKNLMFSKEICCSV
jgi:hypothetical protein